VAYLAANGTPQARLYERVGNQTAALAFSTIRLPDRETSAFYVLDDPRLGDDSRWVDHTANHPSGIDAVAHYTSRIDRLEVGSLPLSAVAIEIPPRNTILHANDTGIGPDERGEARRHLSKAVSLHGQQYGINVAYVARVVCSRWPSLKLSKRPPDAHTTLLHRLEVRPSSDERHVIT
jgi:hypothetical protein